MAEPNETDFNKPRKVNIQPPIETTSPLESMVESDSNVDVVPTDVNSESAPDSLESSEVAPGSRTLEEALEKFNIDLPPKTVQLLNEYCELLWTWNERLNLTRHTTYDKFVARDLIDSIQLASHLQKGEHVLDVGSGGGVPGLVVAILRPDVVVELCEATGKKATALGAMADELGLDINIWYSKAQDLVRERHFHTLTIRAVDRLYKLLVMFRTSWHCFNRILMIKGPKWIEERGEARHYNMFNTLALRKVGEYTVPGPEEDFTSVILQVCQKKKLDELKQRAAELAEGKPYAGSVEEIIVDNRTSEAGARRRNARRSDSFSGERRESKRRSRAFITPQDSRDSTNEKSPSDSDSRVYARRGGRPPKGWAGKKSEFHALTQEGPTQDRTDSGKKDWRPNHKKAGFKRNNRRSGNNKD